MKNLIYKELKISVNKFFFILPVLLGLLMFIPNWIFTIVFMYFFWISMSSIYSGYIAKRDNSFNAMLPVSKKEIVLSKIYTLFILEGVHLVVGIFFGIIHNLIYGQWNFFFDINVAFFGLMVLLYAIFNIVFLPMYFKTGYFFGKPIIYGVVVTFIYGFILEYSVTRYQEVRDIFEGDISTQFIVLLVGVILSLVLTVITIRKSIYNYESIK